MTEDFLCEQCGALLDAERTNVVQLRNPHAAGPPQVDVTDVGDDRVRLCINLVVRRDTAIRVLTSLGDSD